MEAFPVQKIHHLAIDEWDIVISIVTQTNNPFYGLTKETRGIPQYSGKKKSCCPHKIQKINFQLA